MIARFLVALVPLLQIAVFAQSPVTGSQDYGLGGSSIMWLPRPSALFLNPSQLARIHQGEMLTATQRFSNLSSLSSAYFVPSVGTFALGVANEPRLYSLGYARFFGKVAVGGAVNFVRDGFERMTFSLGTTLHFADQMTANSGYHIGAAVTNASSESAKELLRSSAGVAYWILPDFVRVQAAWQHSNGSTVFPIGAHTRVNEWFSIIVGTVSFKNVTGGVGFRSSYLSADVSGGDGGVTFSVNFRFTEDARDVRDRYFAVGMKDYDEERYGRALEHFHTALEYDENYRPARRFVGLSSSAKETTLVIYLREGRASEDRGDYVSAIKMYSQVLKTDPDHDLAQEKLATLKERFHTRIQQLLAAGDSLRNAGRFDRARSAYKEVLGLDPNNQEATAILGRMEAEIADEVQTRFTRAKHFMAKGQVDDAQREYEQILALDPGNGLARSRYESLKARRTTKDLFERGKILMEEGNNFEALTMFLEVVQRDPNNRDAKAYVDRVREALRNEAEDQFKAGLQQYIKENYQAAVEIWNRVLVIQPNHQGTLEYSKRAKDKLEALEKLK